MNKDEIAGLVDELRALAEEWHEMCGDIHEPLIRAADALTTLSAKRDDLRRRLDNICLDIHACNGDFCERPVCVERGKNATLSARVETLESALQAIADRSAKLRHGTDDWFELAEFELAARQALGGGNG